MQRKVNQRLVEIIAQRYNPILKKHLIDDIILQLIRHRLRQRGSRNDVVDPLYTERCNISIGHGHIRKLFRTGCIIQQGLTEIGFGIEQRGKRAVEQKRHQPCNEQGSYIGKRIEKALIPANQKSQPQHEQHQKIKNTHVFFPFKAFLIKRQQIAPTLPNQNNLFLQPRKRTGDRLRKRIALTRHFSDSVCI